MATLLRVRSRAMLITGFIVSALVIGSPIVTWLALPQEIRSLAVGVDLGMIGLVLLAMVAVVLGVALSSVRADDRGLTIVNGPVRHRYQWHEIVDVRFLEGDPWAYVFTFRRDRDGDPQRHMVMAIQAPDGDRARLQAAKLRQIWLDHKP